jgi:glycine betaine transporter
METILNTLKEKKLDSVFYISITAVVLVVSWGIVNASSFSTITNFLFTFLETEFGWLYILSVSCFLGFSLFLAFSKYGKIRLGKDDEKPVFSNMSWFAMLISAGMGIGLVFFGVAEPATHFLHPPNIEVHAASKSAILLAIRTSYFHWALQPWSCYCVIALALAYFQFRKGAPALISSTFKPLLGNKVHGPIGKAIDILTIFATTTGIATSLGLGASQITGGLNFLFGIPQTASSEVIVIIIITLIYITTAIIGLNKGIKFIANLNIMLCLLLVTLVLIIGPTGKIMGMMTSSIGSYLENLLGMSFNTKVYTNPVWMGKWTLFYWAWFIAWAPFVGTFIARISRGRTIREFILGVLFVPCLVTFVWFAVFGTSAINLYFTGKAELLEHAVKNTSSAFFMVFSQYPLSMLISVITIFVICTFFITGGSSATFVLGMLSSKGDLYPKKKIQAIWGILQSCLAIVLLFTGGLATLQTASIAIAFPFTIIMIFICISVYKALREELQTEQKNLYKE